MASQRILITHINGMQPEFPQPPSPPLLTFTLDGA